jgi:hypothetical protein
VYSVTNGDVQIVVAVLNWLGCAENAPLETLNQNGETLAYLRECCSLE